ncbi:MAG: hypothetical protein JEZ08_22560 [Clostridiales bacterium]|nr:hypothetical protein [Clostridiales bacterium]
MQQTQNQKVPDKFLNDFINILPQSLVHEINSRKLDITTFVKEQVEEYYNSEKTNNDIKKASDLYHSRNKRKLYDSTLEAFHGNPKNRKILGDYGEVFRNGIDSLDDKGKELYRQWLEELDHWKQNYHSLITEFVFFNNISKTQQQNSLKKDLLKVLLNYVNQKYSGFREFIYDKSTSAILDHNFFGHPKMVGQNTSIVTRGESQLSYDHVTLFSEHDAKVFNACYHLGFNDMLHSNTMYIDASDVSQYIYGNRAQKNKLKVIESIDRLGKVGYKGIIDNDDIRFSDEFFFFQRTSILEEKRKSGKRAIARIVLNDEYRKHVLKNLTLSFNQSYNQIPLNVKYSFLLNQYILSIRNKVLTDNTITHRISMEELKKHINFSEKENIKQVLSSALDSLKVPETYLEDYSLTNDVLILYIEGVDNSEGAQISMMKQVIEAQLRIELKED